MSLEAILGPLVNEARKSQSEAQKVQIEILRELRAIHELLDKAIQPVGPVGPYALVTQPRKTS